MITPIIVILSTAPGDLALRHMTVNDAHTLAKFLDQHYSLSEQLIISYPVPLVAWLLNTPDSISIGLFSRDGKIAGCICAVPSPLTCAPCTVEVSLLCVRRDLRRTGVARNLLTSLTSAAVSRGVRTAIFTSAHQRAGLKPLLRIPWYHRPLHLNRLLRSRYFQLDDTMFITCDLRRIWRRILPPKIDQLRLRPLGRADEKACIALLRSGGSIHRGIRMTPSIENFRHRFCAAPGSHAFVLIARNGEVRGFASFQLLPIRCAEQRLQVVQAILTAFVLADTTEEAIGNTADGILSSLLLRARKCGAHIFNALPLNHLSRERLEAFGFLPGDGLVNVYAKTVCGRLELEGDARLTWWWPLVF